MPRPKKEASIGEPAGDSASMQAFLKDLALKGYQEKRSEWYRVQLVAWWANVVGEMEAVQAELNTEGSGLHDAFTLDERYEMDRALEQCWGELTSNSKKPQCVPAFLKMQPFYLPKPTSAEGSK